MDIFQKSANALPALNIPSETICPFDRPFDVFLKADYTPLLNIRARHQTERAAKSVRTHGRDRAEPMTEATAKELSARQQLIREINITMRQYADKGIGTGLDRNV